MTPTLLNYSCTNEHQTVEGREKEELAALQLRLEGKIRVSPSSPSSAPLSDPLDHLACNRHD